MISVALCTYNGQQFLPDQLRSLASQSRLPDELVVCDDRSTDGTWDLLAEFSRQASFPVRVERNQEQLGPAENFARCLARARGRWVVLCDQDDVWLPEKISVLAEKMTVLEVSCGPEFPLLIHSDAKVVDVELNTIADSLWAYQGSRPASGHVLNRLLLQNCVTGCTAMVNRALLEKALPIPGQALMHDWWLALVAAVFGQIDWHPEPLVLYRQHGGNDTGAKGWGIWVAIRSLLDFYGRAEARQVNAQVVQKTVSQAKAFVERFHAQLSPQQLEAIRAFASLSTEPYWKKRYLILKHGLYYHGLLRNAGHLLLK
nr:glycosyltransferase family 2 protein [Geothermobacter hydrogeniphilus]